jgi:hypothetical protein
MEHYRVHIFLAETKLRTHSPRHDRPGSAHDLVCLGRRGRDAKHGADGALDGTV